jgi:uracil-DNA glycosylase
VTREVPPCGPVNASIMIVGEAPGADEESKGIPFVGASGQELDRMLGEAGISRSECFITNVCRTRPPGNDITKFFAKSKAQSTRDHVLIAGKYASAPIVNGLAALRKEVDLVKPNITIALGNTSLWALTERWGITKWRGSMLHGFGGYQTIPTIHPAAVLREWAWRSIVVTDLRRAARFRTAKFPTSAWNFITRPKFSDVCRILTSLLQRAEVEDNFWIDFDLETKHEHIDCAGISWSRVDALCIPFLGDYWTIEQEAQIIADLRRLLTHPRVCVRGQNLLYDSQYTYRWWGYVPRVRQDTMLTHHVAFCGMRKSLDFQASLYCDSYTQWKPDKSAWKEGG